MNKFMHSKKSLVALVTLGLSFFGCDLENVTKEPERDLSTSKAKTKSVVVKNFSKLINEPFNFGTSYPQKIAISKGIFYAASTDSNPWEAPWVVSWQIHKGNIETAWKKAADFTGTDPVANFNLNNGQRTIQYLTPIRNGVAVALSEDASVVPNTPNAGPGMAFFFGQDQKASQSSSFFNANGGWSTYKLVSVTTASGAQAVYGLVYKTAPAFNEYILWSNLDAPQLQAQGSGGANNVLQFTNGNSLPLTARISALSSLPDGRVVLGQANGLWTIAKDSVGVSNAQLPKLEQADQATYLDAKHLEQFKTSAGKQPVFIGDMSLVANRYLVIGFYDNGTNNGGMKFADVSKTPFQFSGNLDVPDAKIMKIVTDVDEARLISEDAIYKFRDGIFSLEIDNKKLESKKAYINTGIKETPSADEPEELTKSNFKGGNLGEVPIDGTKFYDAAPYVDAWFYATDEGIFSVKTTTETKTFIVTK